MAGLTIRLFGQISVQRGGQPLPGLSPKALELLCYLLLHRERSHTREALAGVFWPEAPDSLSRKYLRQAIWRLASTLSGQADPAQEKSDELLIVHPGWIRVNPEASCWLDVAAFEQTYDLYRDTPGEELTDSQAQGLEAAVVLYGGDLIEAWYQDWCVHERNRLQLTYLTMLEKLMSYCEARRRYAKGIAYGQCILRHDLARECTHRHLMRLYYQSGDRTTALRQYDRCAAAMAKYFDLEPSRETVSLYHLLRGDRLADPPGQATAAAYPGGDLLLGLQTRLDHIQASLTDLQRQVQQELARSARCRLDVRYIAPAHPG
jgi:DNA-binding SARP family transcriptional activator